MARRQALLVRRWGLRRILGRLSMATPSVDLETAAVHATIAVDLGRQRLPMGAHDLIIAATAVRLGYAVATRDRRGFARIEGLDVEYW